MTTLKNVVDKINISEIRLLEETGNTKKVRFDSKFGALPVKTMHQMFNIPNGDLCLYSTSWQTRADGTRFKLMV